jgi:hypothetical protein
MTDESAKKAILARRARFVAAAVMGVGLASCEDKCGRPLACLDVAAPAPDAAPTPCLSTPIPVPDAGATVSGSDAIDAGPGDAGPGDAGADDGGATKSPPVPKPPPRPCLSRAPEPKQCLQPYRKPWEP